MPEEPEAPPAVEESAPVDEEAAEADKGKWEKNTDEWGEVFYVNSVTGETSWEEPVVVDPAKEALEASKATMASSLGGDLAPEVAAMHGARLVINWLRGRKARLEAQIDEDEDYEAPTEGGS